MLGTDDVDISSTTANGWLADDCDTASKPKRQQAVLLRVPTSRTRPPAIPETRRGGRRRRRTLLYRRLHAIEEVLRCIRSWQIEVLMSLPQAGGSLARVQVPS